MSYVLIATKELVKEASRSGPGVAEKYLPWYGAAGLGGLGSVVGQSMARPKYKVPAAILGSLAGTAVGVHGGEAVGRAMSERRKTSAVKKNDKQPKPPTIPGTIARGIGGMAAGTLLGYGAGRGIEYLAGGAAPRWVPYVASAAGAGLGAAYPLWKAYELEDLRRAQEAKAKEKSAGRIIGRAF